MVVGLAIKYSGGVSQRGYNTSCVLNTTEAKKVVWVSANKQWYSYSLSGMVRPSKSAVGSDFEQKVSEPARTYYLSVFFSQYSYFKKPDIYNS